MHLQKRLFQDIRVDRVQATKRFIHNQNRWVMQDGRQKLHLLLIAFREFFDLLFAIGADLKTFELLSQLFLGGLLR